MTIELNVAALIKKLQAHPTAVATPNDLATMCQEIVDESNEWFGVTPTRKYTISAPAHAYSELDEDGKPTVVRDYFRDLEKALPNDEVIVEVQQGLQAATIQKNIGSMLKDAKNKKWNSSTTARKGKTVIVTFS